MILAEVRFTFPIAHFDGVGWRIGNGAIISGEWCYYLRKNGWNSFRGRKRIILEMCLKQFRDMYGTASCLETALKQVLGGGREGLNFVK